MDYFFTNIKIISALFLLIMLPGLLLLSLLKARATNLDSYEKASFGLVIGMAFWIPIAWLSYGIGLSSNYPIYISILITVGLFLLNIYNGNLDLRKYFISKKYIYKNINFFIVIIFIQAIFIGYTSQYQTANSDALAHLAALRNLATSEIITNCDHILGNGSPIVNTYGCNPWYLSMAMIIKTSTVDAALAYSIITGAIYFVSVLAIYSLFKAISGNIFISKIGSLIFTVVNLMVWLLDNGNTTYNLNSHWVIFPQAIVNFLLFPVMLAAFFRYILHRDKLYLGLTVICFFALTRFHPNWLIWAPVIISGIVVYRNFSIEKYGLKSKLNYRLVYIFGVVSILSVISFVFCMSTFKFDSSSIPPLDLWRSSGGNLLYLSEYIYMYNPKSYLKNRGVFDALTIFLLGYIYLNGKKDSNELLVFFKGMLLTIFLVIFNPFVVVPFVSYLGTPIPIYRVFNLVWPSLSVVTIYAALTSIQIKSKALPRFRNLAIIVAVLFSIVFFAKYASFLIGVYNNEGEYYDNNKSPPYYSTNKSRNLEPFSTLRTLEDGIIAIRTPMSTAVASLTNLDPITTERFRYATSVEYKAREYDNNALMTFDKPYEELLSILKNRAIRYIIIKSSDISSISRFRKHPDLIHFKASAGSDEVWEVNDNL